jgi:hypothetical protein
VTGLIEFRSAPEILDGGSPFGDGVRVPAP